MGLLRRYELLTRQSRAELTLAHLRRALESGCDRESRQTVFQVLIINVHRSNEARVSDLGSLECKLWYVTTTLSKRSVF
jgi:hypothetical protein